MRGREIGGLTTYCAREYAKPSPPAGTFPSSKYATNPRAYLRHKTSILALIARVPTRCFSMVKRGYCHFLCNTVKGKEPTSPHLCSAAPPPAPPTISRARFQWPPRTPPSLPPPHPP